MNLRDFVLKKKKSTKKVVLSQNRFKLFCSIVITFGRIDLVFKLGGLKAF